MSIDIRVSEPIVGETEDKLVLAPPRRGRPPAARIISLSILFLMILLALAAPAITPHDISEQSLLSRLQPPVFAGGTDDHPLGTDHLGRDVFSRLLFATRTTLFIAFAGVFIGVVAGTLGGLISGTLGGWADQCLSAVVDAQAAVPTTLVALTAVALAGTHPLVLVLIIGFSDYYRYARIVRGQVVALQGRSFIEAARCSGASPWRIAMRHVLPNTFSPVVVLASLSFAEIVVLESSLSFLGVGVQPPNVSLGSLLGEARNYLISTPWLAIFPCVVIVMITVAAATIGDWLRASLDPRSRT
ncbi:MULTISPECIES: ABC transporter permease [Mesorhizobium]|uniref:ABC transporter permease n=4 Tax=Mesorhizobium TaxID=68287 RepID=A0ABZ0VHB5_9HYPH|nr:MULTISPECIES: ABC transporter permease [Mesorhizobium]MBZ9909461.1 ABC transporter permease [Mesorhizobium sp. BR115XR7A]QGX80705.1 ABC transporter permease [Mesorhizobium japonicum R7A]QJF04853.1 ABC transporter permease [Mesorhizobium japonicum R7A]QJF10922.1 ABC transporter permease [Mesorhizobium japonicum]QJI86795.1 ABC transporter permease [Mesorhizobium japonicum]